MNRAVRSFCVALMGFLAVVATANADTQLGAAAPEFKLQDQSGKWHQLKDYRGKWVVLYFYPKDMSPGCTTQACEFRDNIFAFRDAGAVVLSISVDDVDSHKRFAEKHGLPFPLLADPSRETARRYEVVSFTGFAKRETFLIDPQGRLVKHYLDVDPKTHPQIVLKDLQQLKKRSEGQTVGATG